MKNNAEQFVKTFQECVVDSNISNLDLQLKPFKKAESTLTVYRNKNKTHTVIEEHDGKYTYIWSAKGIYTKDIILLAFKQIDKQAGRNAD
jgi:hypothetical protein